MVEIECPLCAESIDLGMAEEGAYECPYCEDEFYWDSSLAEYPNIMADEELFSFNNGINKWRVDFSEGPNAGIDSSMHRIAETSAIGIITGRIKPTFTFGTGRKFVQADTMVARSEHMSDLRVFWWTVFIISIPVGIFIPPLLCFTALSILLAIESGAQKKVSDVVYIAASKHPNLLAEEGTCYCYLEQEELILAFLWKGHTIDINTAVHHRSDCYLKINWTHNSYGSHDTGYAVPAIEAVLRYPGRRRKIVMLNHEYTTKESAEEELMTIVRTEPWHPVLGATFLR